MLLSVSLLVLESPMVLVLLSVPAHQSLLLYHFRLLYSLNHIHTFELSAYILNFISVAKLYKALGALSSCITYVPAGRFV